MTNTLLAAVRRFGRQDPMLDPRAYSSTYVSLKAKAKVGAQLRKLILLCRQAEGLSAKDEDFLATVDGTRVAVRREEGEWVIDYRPIEYWPHEFRYAMCVWVAKVIRKRWLEHHKPDKVTPENEDAWIRRQAEKCLGKRIAKEFF